MAEDLVISGTSKVEVYEGLIPQIKALCEGEASLVANMANTAAALKETFAFFWVGFYTVDSEHELVLGPFQGPIACTRITISKGVCGTSWAQNKTIMVDDVEAFPGHISCNALSKSEIVVPIRKEGKVVAVLDVDSSELASFDEVDDKYLNELCTWLGELF